MVWFGLIIRNYYYFFLIIYSKFGWFLAKESRCSRYYSTWSNNFSKWYSESNWLCSFKKTQIWSLFRYADLIYIQIASLDISDRGFKTCAGRPGSLGYETKDANTYASWGVDYLKLDSCFTNGTAPEVAYSIMRDALNATGRPIFFSLCGRNTDCSYFSLYCLSFLFKSKVVLVYMIYGHLMWEIVGEQQMIFKITGIQWSEILIL